MSITEDIKGNLWFGTYGGGVSRYDGKSFTNFTTAQGLTNNYVSSITQDSKGNLWFGTNGGGVSRYDGKSFTNFTKLQGLVNNNVMSITQDSKGNLWFGTYGGGVSRYDGKSFTNFTSAQGLGNNTVLSITLDGKENLWFGTNGGGVCRYDGKSFTNFTTAQELPIDGVVSITQDSQGDLWFGTDGRGMSRYDGKSFTNYTTAQGLAKNYVLSISQDSKGNLWFGTYGGGVSRYDGKSFTNFTTAQGLANNTVFSITQDSKGDLWFGTYGGASRYDGNRVVAIEAALQRGETIPERMQQDLKRENGKFVKSFTNYTTVQGLAYNYVRSIIQDSKGILWFGTDGGGVSRYDGKSFTNYTTSQGLANNKVLSITEDSKGNLWFGTYGGGVSRYDGKSFSNFTTAKGLPDDGVTQVMISPSANLSKGKGGNGRDYIAIGTNFGIGVITGFKPNVTARKELPKQSRSNNEIAELILSKVEGAPQIGLQNNVIPAQNSISNEELKNYTPIIEIYNSSTGYPIKDVNAGQNCMMLDNKGIIWAGTGSNKTGLVRFDYDALIKNTEPPKVVIQNVKLNNENICWYSQSTNYQVSSSKTDELSTKTLRTSPKSVEDSLSFAQDSMALLLAQFNAFGKTVSKAILDSQQIKFSGVQFDGITKFYPLPEHLILPYEHNNISFDFSAIETGKPYLVNYQYILEGYDKEWSPLTKKTSAAFGNIYEGNYTFKLKAQSPEGIWCEPVEYTFKVLPPWWRAWWMYSIDAVVIFILLFSIYRWRTAALRRDKELLEVTVEKRTQELAEKTIAAEANEKDALKQREIAVNQKHIIEEKQKEILDSINYAKRIQQAILPSQELIKYYLPESFIFFRPKDIVSGDFYYIKGFGKYTLLACVDCTGHGVPGGFMSTLGSLLLDKIADHETFNAGEILNKLNAEIISVLHQQNGGEIQDGMDLSLCLIDRINKKVEFSGARNGIIVVTNNEAKRYKADILPVGGNYMKKGIPIDRNFKTQSISINSGDWVYMYTDGFMEQVGGSEGIPMNYNQFEKQLIGLSKKQSSEEKCKLLQSELDNWRGDYERDDDVLIMGFQVG